LTSGATLLSLSGHFDEYIFERFKEKSESLHEREGLGRGVGVGSEVKGVDNKLGAQDQGALRPFQEGTTQQRPRQVRTKANFIFHLPLSPYSSYSLDY
jgi:hypothetical protein